LHPAEIERLLAVPDPADPFGLRDRAILELFYATGVRRTEMTNLDVGDYDPGTHTLSVRKGKGGKSRMLPVGQRAAAWLDLFLAQSRPLFDHLPGETALFLSGYGTRITSSYLGNWVKGVMKRCGIDKPGSCHLFRHSCATHMHCGGADIRYVQEMLGHERLETTQIYTHVHIDALREVHARTHPHGRLDENHGPQEDLTASINRDEELPSPEPGGVIDEATMLLAAQPKVPCAAHPAAIGGVRPEPPPDDEPPTGEAQVRGPKPGPKGGSPRTNGPVPTPPEGDDSSGFQELTVDVSYYGYRWCAPSEAWCLLQGESPCRKRSESGSSRR